MDIGRPPGDELDPQAAPRPEQPAPPPYPPQQGEWRQSPPPDYQPAQAVMVPIPGAVVIPGALLIPAGFGPRFLAFLIDMIVIGILIKIFSMLIGYEEPDPEKLWPMFQQALLHMEWSKLESIGPPAWLTFLQYCIYASYYTFFHAFNGATLGKMALGLQVRQRNGQPLSVGMAAVRWVCYWLTGWLLYTAWMIGFDREKRTAYDALLKLNVFKVVNRQ